MTQPGTPPPYPPYASVPPPRPDLGRAGCLPATLAAAPFIIAAVVCVVLGIMALNEPPPLRPVRQTTTTTRVDTTGTTGPADPTDTTDTTDPDAGEGPAPGEDDAGTEPSTGAPPSSTTRRTR